MLTVKKHIGRQAGFTLIELLITITIIVIMAAVFAGGTIQVQKQVRDDERRTDVAAIAHALEKYYETHGEYPADDDMNPTYASQELPNFNAVKALMPDLSDEDLTGPGGYRFYSSCLNVTCDNSSNNWRDYRTKSYVYISRFTTDQSDTTKYWINVPSWYGDNTGWGCRIETTYADPGFAMAWRREADGIWEFVRSKHGNIIIQSYDTGPVPPQTCAFS